jgi:hypothetical protein
VRAPGWADALVGVAKVAATSDGDGEQVTDRVGVLVHLERPGPDDPDAGRWRATLQQGPRLPADLRRHLTCDGDASVVWEHDGVPVQVGRTHRIVPRRVRRLVLHRDHSCRVPGCNRHLWLQVHHITHWEDGGETVTGNLLCLCGHHHRLHHQGWLAITGDADATTGPEVVRFTFPTGELVAPAPTIRPPDPVDMPSVSPYDGPTGERLQARWFHLRAARDGVDTDRLVPAATSPQP